MPNENEQTLEAILENQDEKLSDTNDLLEKLLETTADNNTENLLDKQLELQSETLEATKKIANSKISIEINGDNTTTYQGEKGDKGDEPTDERLIEIIKPLIPEVRDGKDGKDADEESIVDKVLEIVLPEVPSIEDIVALIPVPTNGTNGIDGVNGLNGLDADEEIIVEKVLAQIPKPKDGSPDTPKQVKEKLLKVGLKYDEIKGTPDLSSMMQRLNQASKTTSLVELDDVDYSELTKTNGKYVLGGGGGAVDSVNGQTGVVVLDTGDIAEATDANYVSDAQLVVIGNTSGTNTGDNATNSQYSGLEASKAPIASPTFTGTVTTPALAMTGNITGGIFGASGPFLVGAIPVRAVGSNLAIGDTDIYTCPSGKRAWVGGVIRVYNPSAGSITYFSQIKVSGTYYRGGSNATLTTLTGGASGGLGASLALEAGESLSINCATTAGLNIVYNVIEYDDDSPVRTVKNLALSNGNNTIYTVPVGKKSIIVGASSALITTVGIFVANNSGGSLNYIAYNVPSGGSVGSTNQMYAATAIGDKSSNFFTIAPTLEAGDFIVLNTSSGNAGQVAWTNVFEI